jgi:peroxiredoxin
LRLPNVALSATNGTPVNPGLLRGRAIIFVYPYTGRPGVPDPPGWDSIFGAHGSTPQALAYSTTYPEFRKHDVKLFGVSNQSTEWQKEFVQRNVLAFPLLSDAQGEFARAVPLACFMAGEKPYYVRRSFLVENGVVLVDRQTVIPPHTDAEIMLTEVTKRWLSP